MPGPIYIGGVIAGLKAARRRQRLHPGLVYKRLAEDGIKSAHSALNHFIFSSDKEGAIDSINRAMYSAKQFKSKELAVGTWNAETVNRLYTCLLYEIQMAVRRLNKITAKECASIELSAAKTAIKFGLYQKAIDHYANAKAYALIAKQYGSGEGTMRGKPQWEKLTNKANRGIDKLHQVEGQAELKPTPSEQEIFVENELFRSRVKWDEYSIFVKTKPVSKKGKKR